MASTSYGAAAQPAEGPTAPAETNDRTGSTEVLLNFQDASLQTVLEHLGLTIVSDVPLDKRMTVISRRPLTLDEAVGLINSVLAESGLAAVRVDKTLKVVGLEEAGQMSVPAAQEGVSTAETAGNATGEMKLLLNFQDASLQTVLSYLSETAGLTIVSDLSLNGRMTVISRQPITVDEAVSLINSVLVESDLTAVRAGRTLKIVTLQQAKQMNIPVTKGSDPEGLAEGDEIVTHVLPLRYVTAAAVRQNLMSLLPEYATMEANADGNALIITDSTSNIKRLMKIVQALDSHLASVAEIRVFRLINADATNAATLINSMFQQDAAAARNRQGGRGNTMEMMMQRGGPGGMAGAFGDMAAAAGGQGSGSGAGQVQVVAAADSRTNSVVVRGPSETLAIVAGVLDALDKRTTEIADVRIVQLRYADALNTADVINRLFGQQSTSSRNQQNTGPGGFAMRGGPGGMQMQDMQQGQSDSTLNVVAAADSQTNTVVVTGPAAILDIVEATIKRLDSQIPNVADVKVFHLQYADAQNTASLVNEIFGSGRTGTTGRTTGRTQQNQQIQFGRGGQQAAQTTGTTSDVTVAASADSRTNSVVVTGPPDLMDTIAQVIKDLDENPQQERQIFVYPLKNGTASNLMTILNNLFQEMQSLNQQTTGRTGQQFQGATGGGATGGGAQSSTASANDLSEETYFEADAETNSLLVLTSTKNYQRIKPILDDLDKPVGQVLIKVLFAEITHSNNVDLGTEFSAWNLRGAGDSNNVQALTAFGSPAGGLTATVFDKTLDVTVRALQQTGKLNILSRPYILTSNNQEATITVGNQVPFATGTTTVAGQTQVTTEYRDIGIILAVTPQINPEGLVIMTVRPEISSTTGDSVQVSSELSLPVFATRTSETKVAVHNGQTIVIGGLIQDEIRDTIKKVPVLGSVPVVGNLFKRTQKEKAKTELLIFLTPHVAADAYGLTPISDAERARSNLRRDPGIAEIFRNHMIGMGGQGNLDADVDVDEPNEP
jgi:general secretion pathway protein D